MRQAFFEKKEAVLWEMIGFIQNGIHKCGAPFQCIMRQKMPLKCSKEAFFPVQRGAGGGTLNSESKSKDKKIDWWWKNVTLCSSLLSVLKVPACCWCVVKLKPGKNSFPPYLQIRRPPNNPNTRHTMQFDLQTVPRLCLSAAHFCHFLIDHLALCTNIFVVRVRSGV